MLARISPAQVEGVNLKRARQVSRGTVDKSLAVLQACFNWSIARGLGVSNPVRRVKLFTRTTLGSGICRAGNTNGWSSRSRIRSARKCYPCARNNPSPM